MTIAAEQATPSSQSMSSVEKPPLKIGIPREVYPGEQRVSATPDTAKTLQKMGFEVWVEPGAGEHANFSDASYETAGCHICTDTQHLWAIADIVLKVRPPQKHLDLGIHETDLIRSGQTLISFIWPAQNAELLEQLAARNATVIAMDAVPRITRAQKMDALSSTANLAGYRAVIEAAHQFGRFFTGQITAAGKVPPAKVLVIGAGVAGLAAIGAARGLGAIVRAFDTRPVVKEQVQSMGAEFLELDFQEDGSGAGGYAKEMSPEFIAA
ncbi:MAG TPA: Re/Si-specific NAD(P)(+) transhydrogenase subunit alpha, partial [Stenomitos sp.]